ncbi:MAG: alpha-1,2-fucosyltransferase [Planctomycetota bacterium]
MIVSRIDGGLGNQLFQYAFGWYTAQCHGTDLVLDLSTYADQPEHGYLLDRLQIQARVLSQHETSRLPRRYQPESVRPPVFQHWSQWPLRKLNLLEPQLSRTKEKPFGFDERFLTTSDNHYLVGYWQSERFFPGVRKELLQQFQPASISEKTTTLAERMLARPSIALHVRRGDYLTNPSAAGIYERLSMDYYRSCLADRLSREPESEVYVFSNDLDWCRQQFDLRQKTIFVDHNDGSTAYEDMLLMSQAQCCVIANSTFSWWGAWLNDRSDRVVYAPSAWFRPETLDGTSILPKSWITMPNQGREDEWNQNHLLEDAHQKVA